MKKNLILVVFLLAVGSLFIACREEKSIPPLPINFDTEIYFNYVDSEGNRIVNSADLFVIYGGCEFIVDMTTDYRYIVYAYIDQMYGPMPAYFMHSGCPENCYLLHGCYCVPHPDGSDARGLMFTKTRTYMFSKAENITADSTYLRRDTIDMDVKYTSPRDAYVESYSFNGKPMWRRDTCKTDLSRNLRIIDIVVDLTDTLKWR